MTTRHDKALLPCPFCGSPASIEQTGNSWQSNIYRCDNCGCSLETSEEFNHGAEWNRRIPIEAGNGGDGWMGIASAPKNQKVLVAYQNELGNWRIVTACYHTQLEWSDEYGDHEQEYAPEDWYEENDSSDVIYPTSRKPTHWRPLPQPPVNGGRK